MTKRVSYFILLALLALAVPLRAAPPMGAVVQTWRYDPPSSAVVVRIVNSSGKDITAWTMKVKETYDNDQINEHEYSTDVLPATLLAAQPGENGTFQAGTSRDERIPVAHPVKDFEATAIVVLYADKTAESTNQEALDRAIEARSVAASTLRTAGDVIRKSLATSSTPGADAATQLKAMVLQWNSQRHATLDLDTGLLEGMARDLQNATGAAARQGITVKEHLTNYLAEHDKRAALFADHAKLSKVGGVQ